MFRKKNILYVLKKKCMCCDCETQEVSAACVIKKFCVCNCGTYLIT